MFQSHIQGPFHLKTPLLSYDLSANLTGLDHSPKNKSPACVDNLMYHQRPQQLYLLRTPTL